MDEAGGLENVTSQQAHDASEEAGGGLGVDPAVWTHAIDYWAETDVTNERVLEDYGQGALRRRDFETLKVGGELTGEIVDEADQHIFSCAPQIAFLDPTFLSKVAH